jgi:DNA-binding FadR family transcriptional regulator
MEHAVRPVRRPSTLHESVQESIQEYIRRNRLKPNDLLLPETEFARQLGVSRNSVREAIKALESAGVVATQRGTGVRVASFSFGPVLDKLPYGLIDEAGLDELAELLDIRRILEGTMFDQALAQLGDQERRSLQVVVARMRERAERGESFPEEDREFHRLLFSGLRNKTLLRLLDVFWLTFTKTMEVIDLRDPDPVRTYRDHAAIADAIVAGDLEAARAALVDRHYAGIAERVQGARDRS